MKTEELDIESLLEDYDIAYVTSGKNVSKGWVEINCPYPDCGDKSFHMGINRISGLYHCWVCGRKGGIEKLISAVLSISYNQAENIVSRYRGVPGVLTEEKEKPKKKEPIKIRKEELSKIYTDYLIERNYDPEFIKTYYEVFAGGNFGKFAFRLVIPVFMNKEIVNYVARDVTGLQIPKYKNLSNDEALVPMKNCIYNIDSANDTAVIVEGVFDVWRIGRGAVAMMGKEFTSHQLKILFEKNLKRAFVVFDSDAAKNSENLANSLSSFVPYVEIITTSKKDPDSLSAEEVKHLRKELKLF
jgi:DNA primase